MIKDKKNYRILVIEDNAGDYTLVEDFLTEQIAFPVITHATSFKEASDLLLSDGSHFDVILLDLTLPDNLGEGLISEMLRIAPRSPIIILTGFTDIEFSVQSIAKGIVDYILKDDLNAGMLYKSIVYAIERKKATLELKESEKRYSDLFHLSPLPMFIHEPLTFQITDVNKTAIEHYGYSYEAFLKFSLFDLVYQDDRQKIQEAILGQERQLNETYTGKVRHCKRSGEIIEMEIYSTPLLINEKIATLVMCIDVTEKNLHEHKITKAIIKTQEDERYEIGGELHDNVCQILVGSLMSLDILKKSVPEPAMPLLSQCKDYINMAASEIRNLSHRLAPAFFHDSKLEDAFDMLLKSFNIENRYEIHFSYDQAMRKNEISLELQLNLYRILQEQLKNILKYAEAKLIELDVFINDSKLNMRIADNGVGFDPATIKKGIGLANIKRRTELFSGSVEITSSPGNGCIINVEIPLES